MKYVRYQSAGNCAGIEEEYDDYWEITEEGHIVRSVNVRPDGSQLKYDEKRDADRFGALPEGKIPADMLTDSSLGTFTTISLAEFEARWKIRAINEEA
jgi:hypothetical protein